MPKAPLIPRRGKVVRGRRAVVSNATPFDTLKLLRQVRKRYQGEVEACPRQKGHMEL
jgi:hypothetical protein